MRQLQGMVFQQSHFGIISITQKIKHQMENIILVAQGNQTTLLKKTEIGVLNSLGQWKSCT